MPEDIRQKPYLNHKDIVGLNFIKAPGIYHFRRHYRAGLRSHIMEILSHEDLEKERNGVLINGVTYFPRARPKKVLRIFRARFGSLAEALEEPRRVKIICDYLAPRHVARSEEFIVDHEAYGGRTPLLCGLQEYVEGEMLDPWRHLDRDIFFSMGRRLGVLEGDGATEKLNHWIHTIRQRTEPFVMQMKALILETGYVPDLAGVGNLILTRDGDIRLVDINNVSKVRLTGTIAVDDRGYPVCDKSIEALSHIERKILKKPDLERNPLYRTFLDPSRMKEVSALVKSFHADLSDNGLSRISSYPAPHLAY